MGIGPLNGISMSAAIGGGVSGQDNMAVMQQLVAAIRVWKLRRGAGRPPLVELVEQESGDVVDLLPPEEVLRMAAVLEKER
jgi:O-acetyl-ADP-ribose deacetylase (regulator of RNase III)